MPPMSAPSDIIVTVDPEIADLVPVFLANRGRDVLTLRDALARSDVDALAITGHRLKGVGGGYGFAVVSELGERIEEAALQGDIDLAARATDELGDYLARVRVTTG